MDLQVAIDRVTLDKAVALVKQLDTKVDTIELGTSLVKDYGLEQIHAALPTLTHAKLLLDLKTIDEGVYEFEKGFVVGDILTAMGAGAPDMLSGVYQVAESAHKQLFIDLMETADDRIAKIADFTHAIYGIHHAKDSQAGFDAAATVADFHQKFPQVQHVSVAGGINLNMAQKLARQGIAESVIVGSAIVKTADPVAAAQTFMEAIH
ncbi:orotidine 5'-phosphate decarboxylase / HUMPS family protein [Levilactobacillus namurensis]|uniref:orotidine 5'-phosphate decarboxylase / HUMPS family protein n=1 Tax=Levilactobacillus namurensis TaxID=380393 RepID=UPI001DE51C6E|nr:orotidine 5'-phosphate decarboxylase / HUMPS family protein [Levilactobacillus namurensis]HJE45021.1 orotidine 5'-phosphate decarboxylase [Levilactobacillus namurensis]